MISDIQTSRLPADAGVLVLAAGKGTRMHSPLPKVLQKLLDKPMLWYLLYMLSSTFNSRPMVVTGHGRSLVEQSCVGFDADFIFQEQQLGTGHALQVAWNKVLQHGFSWLVVINGDTPLAQSQQIRTLLEYTRENNADIGLVSLTLEDPASYGRVLRFADNSVKAVIEAKDYNSELDGGDTREINSGLYVFKVSTLGKILFELDSDNKQQELYITQLISLAQKSGMRVDALNAGTCPELMGINTPRELLGQEEYIRGFIVDEFIEQGVIIRSPGMVRIGPEVIIEPGAEICGPVEIYGQSRITSRSSIASNCYIEDSFIDGGQVFCFSHIEKSVIGPDTKVGPYARLRPGTEMQGGSRAGNFVEIKNSQVGAGSKINHLSYIGDTTMGEGVNVGAGTITCNYDGRLKHRTTVEDGVFIGSNTALVAPVLLQRGSMIAAGSTITRDVLQNSLGIGRSRQKNLEGRSPLKKFKNQEKSD
ncbi:bifunctional UDP-N-acetylglucosamine diphosphorylase/glucosamine-1-phosphate N-acetyltransferase GlmU [Desulfonatronospira sp.]|uniref:bifunctional UDP-N-acetylglucosamine diphosphorylase/glucosamine-1-phosphate N-acetyltransferase GlmU n=1 Tax=Desulfonatronospira sp. TaxID=1962951 RepID=UPI0025BC243D|nr:bifunctional UDP-N-acetylglucosamine diphosphorylase/glucosamine-1-phosphate N-acetyltransferase GlmU [Desulfonatronospira sp.]